MLTPADFISLSGSVGDSRTLIVDARERLYDGERLTAAKVAAVETMLVNAQLGLEGAIEEIDLFLGQLDELKFDGKEDS